jgi:hypothetical protein
MIGRAVSEILPGGIDDREVGLLLYRISYGKEKITSGVESVGGTGKTPEPKRT